MTIEIIYKTKSLQDGRDITIIWHDLVGEQIPDERIWQIVNDKMMN